MPIGDSLYIMGYCLFASYKAYALSTPYSAWEAFNIDWLFKHLFVSW